MADISLLKILRENSKKNIFTLFILSCMMMISSVSITGLPLLFLEPKLYCDNKPCNIIQACKTDYKIDLKNGIKSITSEFDMICEKRYL